MSKREMLKDKDFFIYDQEASNEPLEEDLFGPSKPTISEYTQKMPSAAKKEPLSTAKKQLTRDCEDRWPAPTEQRGIRNALDVIKKQ